MPNQPPLGFNPARVFVGHPIQDRTDQEMQALADDAIEHIMKGIQATTDEHGKHR